MSLRKCFFIFFVWLLPNLASYGRTDYLSQSYNPHGNNPIKRAYVLYAREVTRDIYLDVRQNQPCFMRGREISKVLLDGVKNKLLLPYKDDTFEEVMLEADFLKRLQISDEEGGLSNVAHEFFPHQISILRLVEHVIFNKITARQEYDIESIELTVPGKKNPPTYLDHTIAIFKYKDVIDYFNKLPFDLVCWYNAANPAESLTWADAFDLRLFLSGSRIVKASNVGDAMVDEIYEKTPGDGKGLIMSEKLAVEVDIELETFMSEY